MKINLHIILCFLGCIGLSYSSFCQNSKSVNLTLPLVSLLDIEPTGGITLGFSSPTEAGNSLKNPTPNTSKWVNYTSAIRTGGATKMITAAINLVIPGIDIKIQAGGAAGLGAGTLGSSTGSVTLSTTGKTIITGIGGAYTGNGVNNGHQLTISAIASTSNYSLIKVQPNTQLQITYTISSN